MRLTYWLTTKDAVNAKPLEDIDVGITLKRVSKDSLGDGQAGHVPRFRTLVLYKTRWTELDADIMENWQKRIPSFN